MMRNLEQGIVSSSYPGSGLFAETPCSIGPGAPDAAERERRLAAVIAQQIIPRLMQLHQHDLAPCAIERKAPSPREIERLTNLVLGPDAQDANSYMLRLKRRGVTMDTVFTDVLEPAARHLGKMWEESRCDFVEATLGVARLQELLAVFNEHPTGSNTSDMRRVWTGPTIGEQNRFGIAMAEKFLRAAGWHVRSEVALSPEAALAALRSEWFAVAGLALSNESRLKDLALMIKKIREQSCNKSIGIIVTGSVFASNSELADEVGADAVAVSAPVAVILAQKLFVGSRVRTCTAA